jgi:hypothetical protein
VPRYLALDILCGPCERAGDPNPPRLARFIRRPDGEVYVEPFTPKGRQRYSVPFGDNSDVIPDAHRRPDRGYTWRLGCPQGHDKPIRHERIVAAFDNFPPGRDTWRIAL